MKNLSKILFPIVCLLITLSSCENKISEDVSSSAPELVTPTSDDGDIIQGQYIITMKESAVKHAQAYVTQEFTNRDEQIKFLDAKSLIVRNELENFLVEQGVDPSNVLHYYTVGHAGFAAKLSEAEYERMTRSEKISSIEYDRRVQLDFQVDAIEEGAPRAQQIPCGITRHGGAINDPNANTWVFILDSGIDLDHPDLNVNTSNSRSFVGGSANDCNGHGTHVAGTVAARNNNLGVVGMSAGATLVAVRVFGCSGGSATSTIIAGVDYINSRSISGDVMNASLGGGSSNCGGAANRNAYLNLANKGVWCVVAAGNNASNANGFFPACINANRFLTVASMTCSNRWSYFSNFGIGPIDWIATGSSVRSTYLNGGYATLSGTSMASPHVAGIVKARGAANPVQNGTVSNRGLTYRVARR